MANTRTAKSEIKKNAKRHKRNVARKSEIKTLVKKYLAAIEDKNIEKAQDFLKTTEAKIARAKGKKIIKKNTASNKISRLAKKLVSLKKSSSK